MLTLVTAPVNSLSHQGSSHYHHHGEDLSTQALRSIRCASFARSTSTGGAFRRRIKIEKRAVYATRERLERLQLLEIEFTLKKRLCEDSDASHEGQGYVPVDMCGIEAHNLYHLLQNHFKDHNTRDLYGTKYFSDLMSTMCVAAAAYCSDG